MLKAMAIPEQVNIPSALSQLQGNEVASLAFVGLVGEGRGASVVAFITPDGVVRSTVFRHAIKMEGSYSDSLLSFHDSAQPYYRSAGAGIDLNQAAIRLGIDRILCLVTLDSTGVVSAVRDYDGLEVTLLEAAHIQLSRFTELIEDDVVVESVRMQ